MPGSTARGNLSRLALLAPDDGELELAAEHFFALVEALPSRLADFGVFRSHTQAERHLQYAVKLFLRAVAPTGPATEAPRETEHPHTTPVS